MVFGRALNYLMCVCVSKRVVAWIVEWWLLGDYTALCVSLRTSWTENDGFVLPCVGLHCDQDDSAKGFMAGCVCVCVCGVQVST